MLIYLGIDSISSDTNVLLFLVQGGHGGHGTFGVMGQRALSASAVSSTQNNRYATVAHCRVARPSSLRDTALIHLSTCNFSVQCQYSEFDRSYSSYNSCAKHTHFQHSLHIYIEYLYFY